MVTDADDYFALQTDSDYVDFIGPEISRERFDRQFEITLGGDPERLSLTICTAEDGTFVGEAVLEPSSSGEVELVIAIAREHRQRGYALEATREVASAALRADGVHTVMVCVEDENAASLRLVKKLGMTRIGRTLRLGGKKPTVFVLQRDVSSVLRIVAADEAAQYSSHIQGLNPTAPQLNSSVSQ